MKLTVIVHQASESGYWAEVPAIPGCATEGDSWDELISNLHEAILLEDRLRQRRLFVDLAHTDTTHLLLFPPIF